MPVKNMSRRLERVEAELTPPSDKPALTIHVTSPGQPDRIIEVRGSKTADRRRRPWSARRACEEARLSDQQAAAQA